MIPRITTLLGRSPWLLSRLIAVSMLILLGLINACSDSSTEPVLTDYDRIQETTLRFMTELHWASHYTFVTFALMDGTPRDNSHGKFIPLPDPLYQRLGDITHPIRPFAECMLYASGLHHPDFEKYGICIWVGDVTQIGAREVVVYSGYYVSPLGAEGYFVRLEKKNDAWEVAGFTMLWIS